MKEKKNPDAKAVADLMKRALAPIRQPTPEEAREVSAEGAAYLRRQRLAIGQSPLLPGHLCTCTLQGLASAAVATGLKVDVSIEPLEGDDLNERELAAVKLTVSAEIYAFRGVQVELHVENGRLLKTLSPLGGLVASRTIDVGNLGPGEQTTLVLLARADNIERHDDETMRVRGTVYGEPVLFGSADRGVLDTEPVHPD